MKKTTFNISFDEDKASALVLYLSQKGTTAEAELEKALDTLYSKTVPAGVREYIELRSGNTPTPAAPKPRKPKAAASGCSGTTHRGAGPAQHPALPAAP